MSSIQSPERAAEIINAWFSRHPELVNDNHNAEVLGAWIKKYHGVGNELIFSEASLEMAFQTLASSGHLKFYASPDTQARIQQVTQTAQSLLSEKRKLESDAEAERKRVEARLTREARQNASGPGRASAMAGAEDVTRKIQEEANNARKSVEKSQRHSEFLTALADANRITIVIPGTSMVKYGATGEARKNARELVKRRWPEFASEIN